MSGYSLHWTHGQARVLTTAAMLAGCTFLLDGRPFAPFARAPWMDGPVDPQATGHLRVLGGDFVCLPFGIGRAMLNAPPDWSAILSGPTAGPIHGPAAENDWTVTDASDTAISLALDYPEASPVRRVERTVAARADASALDFVFRIFARRPAAISTGLHPILRLPDRPGGLHLTADFAFGMVHPGYGGKTFHDLTRVPLATGNVNLSQVPLSPRADLNVQLCGLSGPLTALYTDENAGIVLDWDRDLLPSLQIWHTDGGIGGPPWHNAYRGIGVEPIASAFDLDTSVSCGPNPINARGVATAIRIDPGHPVTIRHSVRAFAI